MTVQWEIKTGSHVGPSHERRGVENQDSMAWVSENNMMMIVVADGAGSLERSREGADFVVDHLTQLFTDYAHDENSGDDVESMQNFVDTALRATRTALLAEDDAESKGCTVAVMVANEHGDWTAATVGDAFGVVVDIDHKYSYVSAPPQKYANLTQLITVPREELLSINTTSGTMGKFFAVATDGLSHASIYQQAPHENFWNSVFTGYESGTIDFNSLYDFMHSHNKIDDDTTLIVAYQSTGQDTE